jgi:hypothetical protein
LAKTIWIEVRISYDLAAVDAVVATAATAVAAAVAGGCMTTSAGAGTVAVTGV